MRLTDLQKAILRQAIAADPALEAYFVGGNGNPIAEHFNTLAVPDVIVWRDDVSSSDIYHTTSPEGTTWNWQTFKTQDAREQTAWREMFMGDFADFTLDNLRAGVAAIFNGTGAAATQRTHIYAVAKRKATKFEALFATGANTLAEPGKFAVDADGNYLAGELSPSVALET